VHLVDPCNVEATGAVQSGGGGGGTGQGHATPGQQRCSAAVARLICGQQTLAKEGACISSCAVVPSRLAGQLRLPFWRPPLHACAPRLPVWLLPLAALSLNKRQ